MELGPRKKGANVSAVFFNWKVEAEYIPAIGDVEIAYASRMDPCTADFGESSPKASAMKATG